MARMIKFRKTTHGKMVIFFSLFIVLIATIQLYAFSWSNESLVSKSLGSTFLQTQSYALLLENKWEHVRSVEFDMYADEDLKRLSQASEILTQYEKASAIKKVCRRLATIAFSSELIENINILIPSLNISLYPDGYAEGNYVSHTDEEINNILAGISSDRGIFISYENGKLLAQLKSPTEKNATRVDFLITVAVSVKEIQKQYEMMVTSSEEPYILDVGSGALQLSNIRDHKNTEFASYCEKETNSARTYKIEKEDYYIVKQQGISSFGSITQFLSKSKTLLPLKPLRIINAVFLIGIFLTLVAYTFFSYSNITKPIAKLANAFKDLEKGDFSRNIDIDRKDDFSYLYEQYNTTLARLEQLIHEVYETQILLQKAELKQLQSQINPHFLYNSYFLLHRLIKAQDFEKSVKFSKGMGQYFQYITRDSVDMVPLEDESRHAGIYAGIQAMRFEERIEIVYEALPEALKNFMVPKLIMQPIIENAFEHGLENKSKDGILRVSFTDSEDMFTICVEDNGVQADSSTIKNMQKILEGGKSLEYTAIINIHKRIQSIFGSKSGLEISISELGGVKSKIVIYKPQKRREIKSS